MKHIFPALVVVAAIAVSVYFYRVYGREPGPLTSTAVAAVSTDAPVHGDVFVMGITVPVKRAALTMGISGKVAEVFVQEGDKVSAGQVLLRLENADRQVAVTQAEARLRSVQAELAQLQAGARSQEIVIAQSAVDIAEANLARINGETPVETAAIRENAIAKSIAEAELRSAQAQLELLQAGPREEEIAAAQAAVDEAAADLLEKQLDLAASELRAPFDGVVGALTVTAGAQIGTAEVVAQVGDLSAWQIESLDLDELSVARVQVGDKTRIAFDAVPGLVLTGKIAHITTVGTVKSGDVMYGVVVTPDTLDPVRWNMTAQVDIVPQDRAGQ